MALPDAPQGPHTPPRPHMPELETLTDRPWFAVIAKPRQEAWALENLLAQDYAAWLPICRYSRQRAVRHAPGRRVTVEEIGPLFPRYLFAGAGQNQAILPIVSTRGVTDIVRTPSGYPVAVGERALLNLHERIAKDGGLLDLRPIPKYTVGEQLKILDGPFSGLSGECSLSEIDRVKILLDMMGSSVGIELHVDQVERDRAPARVVR